MLQLMVLLTGNLKYHTHYYHIILDPLMITYLAIPTVAVYIWIHKLAM